MVILKTDHLKIIREMRKRAWKIHSLLILIVLALVGLNYLNHWDTSLIRESYSIFKRQYDSILAKQQIYSLLRSKPLSVGQGLDIAEIILTQNRVPIPIALAMISVESDFDPEAISDHGARGLTQTMPIFIMNKTQAHNVSLNVKIGLTYLADLYDQFKDWRRALRAYNGGPKQAENKKLDKYVDTVLYKAKGFEASFKGL